MINLLPPNEKVVLTQETAGKLVSIIGLIVLLSLTVLSLILFILKTYLGNQVEAQKVIVEQWQTKFKGSELQDLQEKIKSTNLSFNKLKAFYEQKTSLSQAVEKISESLPDSVYLYTFSLVAADGKKIQVSLSGFAPDRDVLFTLKKNLEAQPLFKEVYFPPTSWVKAENIDFFVNLKME